MSSNFVFNMSNSVFLVKYACTSFDNLLKSPGTAANLSISSLSTSVFNVAKLVFRAKFEVST